VLLLGALIGVLLAASTSERTNPLD
jgi:hypothetical protein